MKALLSKVETLQAALTRLLSKRRQDVLDEMEGKQREKKVTTGLIPLTVSLVQAIENGTLTASAG